MSNSSARRFWTLALAVALGVLVAWTVAVLAWGNRCRPLTSEDYSRLPGKVDFARGITTCDLSPELREQLDRP